MGREIGEEEGERIRKNRRELGRGKNRKNGSESGEEDGESIRKNRRELERRIE